MFRHTQFSAVWGTMVTSKAALSSASEQLPTGGRSSKKLPRVIPNVFK